ncbi:MULTISPECIES: NAD(P)/FAD-dependent oxidoreductase [Methylomonas]|uniref:FAD-dependent oxidoreductase n=2 Tax=Methylomonas TaxID=416 RepID=A0A126T8E0_9GAMM|nr:MULTISPECIES: FAD-dependent oxidoreductase [Methylomonas]AMK78355.1 FAD-dependent oxidoreductase [Methylomonas denitrificans]OAI04065.1 FAD-dependent oxidoreductase [Methylomonas methanica]TCV87615.1 glycine/D-amino acid oxidase-like deaminating enzyme [Methylomonas methanica]
MQIDVLLIGQGLAGSLLAWELLRRQLRILVVDDGAENASQVAAGLINPVTGQRLVKQVDVETLLPAAMHVYRQLGTQFRQCFYVQMPMLKILRTEKELGIAERRLAQQDYRDYLTGLAPVLTGIEAPYGVLQQWQTGYLRTEALLSQLRDFLRNKNCYRRNSLQYSEINLEPALQWRGVYPRHIVFCEGYQAIANPWFRYLPFQLAKGEILACESRQDIPQHILNYGHWLIPLGPRLFKTGATFDTNQLDNLPTQQAQTTLLASLRAVFPLQQAPYVYQHRAGIRPATLDKQPFIGTHPRHSQLHIFNGFGAKGSLAIPWYAARFADYLQQQAGLPPGCNIRRYDETHFPA